MLYLPTFGKFIRGQIDINTPYIERLGANPLRTWCMKFWSGGLQIQTSRVPPRGFFFVDWNDLKCIYQPFQCSPQQAVVGAVCHWLPLPVASPRWWCSRKPPLSRQSPFPVWRMLSTLAGTTVFLQAQGRRSLRPHFAEVSSTCSEYHGLVQHPTLEDMSSPPKECSIWTSSQIHSLHKSHLLHTHDSLYTRYKLTSLGYISFGHVFPLGRPHQR